MRRRIRETAPSTNTILQQQQQAIKLYEKRCESWLIYWMLYSGFMTVTLLTDIIFFW
jgi:hypothetical protein